MFYDHHWQLPPPPSLTEFDRCLSDDGSLTDCLSASGHSFSVTVLFQGLCAPAPDESELISVGACPLVLARHVTLNLDGTPVVVARSIALPDDPFWHTVLERGSRALGHTLFAAGSGIQRTPLHYQAISAAHPLFKLAREHDPSQALSYPARRSHFIMNQTALNVCEVFLPALKDLL